MKKNKEQKRKAQLSARAKNESFRFQVEYMRKQKGIEIAGMEQALDSELETICQNGLTDALFTLPKILEGVRQELGFEQEWEKCSLNGAIVPFILGITNVKPDATNYVPNIFNAQPMKVTIAYDNEIRNRVVDWVKAHYDGVKTLLGQPILKMENMTVEFKRVIK